MRSSFIMDRFVDIYYVISSKTTPTVGGASNGKRNIFYYMHSRKKKVPLMFKINVFCKFNSFEVMYLRLLVIGSLHRLTAWLLLKTSRSLWSVSSFDSVGLPFSILHFTFSYEMSKIGRGNHFAIFDFHEMNDFLKISYLLHRSL